MLSEELKRAIELSRQGNKTEARVILKKIILEEPANEPAWLWFIDTLNNDQDRIMALEGYLKINPQSQVALRTLHRLQARKEIQLSESAGPTTEIPYHDAEKSGEFTKETGEEDLHRKGGGKEKRRSQGGEFKEWLKDLTSSRSMLLTTITILAAIILLCSGLVTSTVRLMGYDSISEIFTPVECSCNDVKSYMERVASRIERWKANQALYELSTMKNDGLADTSFAFQLYEEEKNEDVPGCMEPAHEIFLELLDYHVRFAEGIVNKDYRAMDINLQLQGQKRDELRILFEQYSKGYNCAP